MNHIYNYNQTKDYEPTFIRVKHATERPHDYPKKIDIPEYAILFSGDSLVFASNEHEYFTFSLRIKSIK